MEKKTRDTSKKRDSILEAAGKAFQKYGFDNTSMDQIAEEAGASKRTVYNHFKSKDELLYAVIDKFARETTTLKEIPFDPDRTVKSQLFDFIDAHLLLLNNEKWLGLKKIFISVFIRDNSMAQQMVAKYETGEDQFEHWLTGAIEAGVISAENPKMAAGVFKSMLTGIYTWPMLFVGPLPAEMIYAFKEEIAETFLARFAV